MPIRTPSGLKLTYEDYAAIPDDGRRHEILDGIHVVSPAPTPPHQHVSRWIQFQLFQAIEVPGHGLVINAPIDVHLGQFDVLQPDLVVIAADRRSIVGAKKIESAPDLVVEILSPSTERRDRGAKRLAYVRGGVPEYWIVDPPRRSVESWILQGHDSVRRTIATESIAPARFPDAVVDLTKVW